MWFIVPISITPFITRTHRTHSPFTLVRSLTVLSRIEKINPVLDHVLNCDWRGRQYRDAYPCTIVPKSNILVPVQEAEGSRRDILRVTYPRLHNMSRVLTPSKRSDTWSPLIHSLIYPFFRPDWPSSIDMILT